MRGSSVAGLIPTLVTWTWPLTQYGPEYWENLGVDQADRERLSPIRRPQLAPLLLIQGDKNIQINSETQAITIRGLVRTADINTNNSVASTQIGDLEVRLNGKGVVGDAVRRPNALYRLLLGVLPF